MLPCHLNRYLLEQYTEERATISGLGTLPPSEVTEGSPGPNEGDPAISALMASPTQASLWEAMPKDVPSITHISHSPSLPAMLKIPEVASTFPIPQLQAPHQG